jgi:predicted acetyltransferase
MNEKKKNYVVPAFLQVHTQDKNDTHMKLREWMYQSRITITDFAKELDIHRTYLQLILCGKKIPSVKLLNKIRELTFNQVSTLTDIQD